LGGEVLRAECLLKTVGLVLLGWLLSKGDLFFIILLQIAEFVVFVFAVLFFLNLTHHLVIVQLLEGLVKELLSLLLLLLLVNLVVIVIVSFLAFLLLLLIGLALLTSFACLVDMLTITFFIASN